MKHKLGMRTIKTAVGATLAMLISESLGLNYALSAGIITVLSVQNTKRKSLETGLARLNSTLLALGISCLMFTFWIQLGSIWNIFINFHSVSGEV